jgi:hypothetical protein
MQQSRQGLKRKFVLPVGLLVILANSGCVVTSHYHTARTLEKNTFALGINADDIAISSEDKSVSIKKKWAFSPSVVAAWGLPYRLEIGAHCAPPDFIEGSMRFQVNPRSFELFDCSLNLNYAQFFDYYAYLKYGFSLSKSLTGIEPYIHFDLYHFLDANSDDFSLGFFSEVTEASFNRHRSVGFGIAVSFQELKLLPEINYQYFVNEFNNGIWHFGIGIRIVGHRAAKREMGP